MPDLPEPKAVLHMWAIVPPPDLAAQIDGIRREFSEHYQCYKALRPPVHLTLYKPFGVEEREMAGQLAAFGHLLAALPAFPLTLKDFSYIDRSRSPVIFIDVVPDGRLEGLNRELSALTVSLFGLDRGRTDFHPHFTIGYRDVPARLFPGIKKAYSDRRFSATWDVHTVCLFRHNGLKWELIHTFPLAGDP